MDRYCPHRRASLVFGRNEDCGLRCLYHGWKMDVAGNVVEMPSETAGSGLAQKVKHRAYPVHECGWLRLGLHGPAGNDARVRAAAVRAGDRTRSSRS